MNDADSLGSRRNLLKSLLTAGIGPGLLASTWVPGAEGSGLDQEALREANPDFDAQAFGFWNDFLKNEAEPIVGTNGQVRGSHARSDVQPVFMHFGPQGFTNAAELDAEKLIPEGDVSVSMNTSTLKIADQDLETFRQLQNAQIRVDVVQKTSIIPAIEAMAYTVIGAMDTSESDELNKKSPTSTAATAAKKRVQSIQNINLGSDSAWQKMQNVLLPKGEGRWALNLEAQRKDSLFCKVLRNMVTISGQFAPVMGLPGVAVSALQSFNALYGALHSRPVTIIEAPPTRIFATQQAYQNTGSPGATSGLLLQSGTYILFPLKQLPPAQELSKLTITQGRVVPLKTAQQDLNEAAASTLKDVTYVTFDVEVSSTSILGGSPAKT
jgi:hypothetical protein